jgi:hypothetical protein
MNDPSGGERSAQVSRSLIWILFVLLLSLNLVGIRPGCNPDLLGYIGVAHVLSGFPEGEIHARTYESAGDFCGRDRVGLARGSPYLETIASNPDAFAQQLPFYSVKPVYPLLIAALAQAGINPAAASWAISLAAYVGIAVCVMLWLGANVGLPWAMVAAWSIVSLTFVVDLARLSTPDAISTLTILVALYQLFVRRRPLVGLALLVASVAVRPDNLFWLAAAGVYVAVMQPGRRIHAAVAGLLGVVIYGGIASWSGTHGWRIQFYHQFVGRLAYPAGFESPLGLGDYVWIYLRETHPASLPAFFLLLSLIGLGTAAVRIRLLSTRDPWVDVLTVVATFMVTHWLFYPEEDRLLAAAYVLILMGAVQTVYDLTRLPASASGEPARREARAGATGVVP